MAQQRRRQQKETTARRIFEAGVHLFLTRGYAETTVEMIAEAAGVAKGTFFVHFPSKEALLGHMGRAQMERIGAAIAAEPGFEQRDFRSQLAFIYRVFAAGAEEQPELVRSLAAVMLRQQGERDVNTASFDAVEGLFAPLVERAQERGELRGDVPPARIASLLRAVYFHALFVWLRHGGSLPDTAEAFLDLALEGMRPPQR